MAKKEKVENENAFKHMYSKALVERMAKSIETVHPDFNTKSFLKLVPHLEALEMKPRVLLIRDELQKHLPQDYEKALKILVASTQSGKMKGFDLWPYTEFVQTFGIDYPDLSLPTLREFTKLFTSEWAIRPFIKKDQEATLQFLLKCAQSKDIHLRRWASEGTRPRLPWGERLQDFVRNPEPTLPILEQLKFDDELYVRKSVANHLNDIAKDHPDYVVKVLARWQKEASEKDKVKINWIIHRALRTLIKNGHKGALKLIGVDAKPKVKIDGLKIKQKKIKVGESLHFEFNVLSQGKSEQKLVVDYVVHFVKANKGKSAKVFKLKSLLLSSGQKVLVEKKHSFKKITTREYYSGEHFLEIQVNGVLLAKSSWFLQTTKKREPHS